MVNGHISLIFYPNLQISKMCSINADKSMSVEGIYPVFPPYFSGFCLFCVG